MTPSSSKRKRPAPAPRKTKEQQEIDLVACTLHNTGVSLSGNTQASDVDWFARWLYGSSNFGLGSVDTMKWSLSNSEFEKLGLIPDRPWTDRRWDTLDSAERDSWVKLARLCLYALPHIAERIGHRFMEQARALRIINQAYK